jgi:hypothetical protein
MKLYPLIFVTIFALATHADNNIVDEIMQTESAKKYVEINTYIVNAACTDPNVNLTKEDTFKVCVAAKKFDAKNRIDTEFRKSLTQYFSSNPSKVSEARKNIKNEDALGSLIVSPLMGASAKIGNEWAAALINSLK